MLTHEKTRVGHTAQFVPGPIRVTQIDAAVHQVEAMYRDELRWPHGLRVNLDARLLLLGLERMRRQLHVTEPEFSACGVVVGCRLGAMESYEAFERSMAGNHPAPLAFAHALPSIPLACASLRFRLQGQTLTLVGGVDVGVRAVEQAMLLVRAGREGRIVAGCWEVPSETASLHHGTDGRCRLLLTLVDRTYLVPRAFESTGLPVRKPRAPDGDGPVARLARYLRWQEHAAGAHDA